MRRTLFFNRLTTLSQILRGHHFEQTSKVVSSRTLTSINPSIRTHTLTMHSFSSPIKQSKLTLGEKILRSKWKQRA